MNKRLLTIACLAVFLTSGAFAAEEAKTPAAAPADAPTASADPPNDTVIATINGQQFSLGLFRLFYGERLRAARSENSPEFQNLAFNEFVNIVVTSQDAKDKGMEKTPELAYAMELQKMQLLSRLALEQAASAVKPTDEEVKKVYDDQVAKLDRLEYKARHILVKDEAEAKKIIKQLDGGKDFIELAKAHSEGPTGKNGGDLGWFDPEQMVPAFSAVVVTLKPGSYTKEPVQTQFGWHVILLEETRKMEPPSLESVKPEIVASLQREALTKYVGSLQEKAKVDLNPDLIKQTAPPAQPEGQPQAPSEVKPAGKPDGKSGAK